MYIALDLGTMTAGKQGKTRVWTKFTGLGVRCFFGEGANSKGLGGIGELHNNVKHNTHVILLLDKTDMRSDDYERCINRAMTTTRDVSTGQWRLREMYQQGNDTLLGLGQCKRDSCPNAQNIVLWGNWFGDNVCGVQMFLNVYNISKRSRMTQMDVNGQKQYFDVNSPL